MHTWLTRAATDQGDESLQKWKKSLGLGQGKDISDPNDPRRCIILSLALEVEGRDDIVIDLRAPGAVEALEKKPFAIKEGARFRMKAQFKVQHDILSGLKYLQKVSRMGVSEKLQEMMVRTPATVPRLVKY
jgi:Rho GDP-dissociation inhibitor